MKKFVLMILFAAIFYPAFCGYGQQQNYASVDIGSVALLAPLKFQVFTVDTSVYVPASGFHIPFKTKIVSGESLVENVDFNFKVKFDSWAYFPDKSTNGEITDDYYDADFKHVLVIHVPGVNISNTETTFTELVGEVLKGIGTYTKIEIFDFTWDNPDLELDTIINGSLTKLGCALLLTRTQTFIPASLEIKPNPAGKDTEMTIEGSFEGEFTLNLYNIQGILVDSKNYIHQKGDTQIIKYALSDFPNGCYYVILITPFGRVSKTLYISK